MRHGMYAVFLSLFMAGQCVAASAPAAETGTSQKKNLKAMWEMQADPALPNVLILGDSISIGYTLEVRRLLAGKANVFRPLAKGGEGPQNCGGTTAGVKSIDVWLGKTKWDVIHFNWGAHDLKHVGKETGQNSNDPSDPPQATVEQYSANLEELVKKLKATGAKLIFATTTPVVPGTTSPLRDPDAPPRYNEAALKIMKANGVKIDDLYSFALPRLEELQLPHNVHFKREGSLALAEQVAKSIAAVLDSTH